jgi:peptidoglycan hydrolase-like protein with peptidoglycan-binding domain
MKKILIFIFSIIICIAIPTAAYAAEEEFVTLQMGSTGNQVIIVQQALRSLGFLNFRATGKYSNITFEAVRRFQQANRLPDDGQIGASTFELLTIGDAKIAPKNSRFKLIYGPYLENPSAYGDLTPWSEVSAQLTVGSQVTIKDLYSSKSFRMQRTGGINNARVETLSQADTDTFTNMFGGGSTWEKRPVLATVNGKTFAASLFGAPDGDDTITNNGMQGGTQLYFYESKSDVLNIPDEEHMAAVVKAAGKA